MKNNLSENSNDTAGVHMSNEIKYGITLKMYAEILVKTINAKDDSEEYRKIIEKEGILYSDWKKAKKEWDDIMNDPNDNGYITSLFMPLYQTAIENNLRKKGPCSLEKFAKVHCELTNRREKGDPLKQVEYETVLSENGFTVSDWEYCNSFWLIRVGMPNYRKKFSELLNKYSLK
jgi:hypothetical protein